MFPKMNPFLTFQIVTREYHYHIKLSLAGSIIFQQNGVNLPIFVIQWMILTYWCDWIRKERRSSEIKPKDFFHFLVVLLLPSFKSRGQEKYIDTILRMLTKTQGYNLQNFNTRWILTFWLNTKENFVIIPIYNLFLIVTTKPPPSPCISKLRWNSHA